MFQKPKPFPTPKGATESFSVKYQGGRKPFSTRQEAEDFAKVKRGLDNGWAEITRVLEIIVSPR